MLTSGLLISISSLSLGAVSGSATTTILQKRADVSDVLEIISTLGSAVTPLLDALDAIVASGVVTTYSLTPPIEGIVSAFNAASGALIALGTVNTASGGTVLEVASVVAIILAHLFSTLAAIDAILPGGISSLLVILGLVIALVQFLDILEEIFPGILVIIGGLILQIASFGFVPGLSSIFALLGI